MAADGLDVKRFYRAQSRIDAYLVLHHLEGAGIRAHVFHGNASSIAGEIPPDFAQPEVWLENPDDESRARRLVDSMMAPSAPSAPVACRHCGEENPGNFELCWQCGASL